MFVVVLLFFVFLVVCVVFTGFFGVCDICYVLLCYAYLCNGMFFVGCFIYVSTFFVCFLYMFQVFLMLVSFDISIGCYTLYVLVFKLCHYTFCVFWGSKINFCIWQKNILNSDFR